MNNQHFVSIIIPALNEEKVIGKCLKAIENLDTPRDRYEVMVVDNGSTDNTLGIVSSFKELLNIKVVEEPVANISALRNLGVKHSKGEVLAFVDADCVVSRDWLNNAIKYFSDPGIGAVGCHYKISKNSTWVARTWHLNNVKNHKIGEIDNLPAGNLFVSRRNFYRINGFDESLITNEDYDFCFRLQRAGLKIYSDTNIASVHLGEPQNLMEFYRKHKWHGATVLKVFLKDISRLNNLRAVSYAVYYVFCLLGLILSSFIIFNSEKFLLFFVFILAVIIAPLILSIRTVYTQKRYRCFFSLTILYLIYGIARAECILNIRNWLIPRIAGKS